jgi:hypothetical protein
LRVDVGTGLLTFALATLALGPWASLGILITLSAAACGGLGIFSDDELRQLRELAAQGMQRARRLSQQLGLSATPSTDS